MPSKCLLILKMKHFLTQTPHHLETKHHYEAQPGATIYYSLCRPPVTTRFPNRQRSVWHHPTAGGLELEHLIVRMLEIQRRELCCRRPGWCIDPQIGKVYGLNLVSGFMVNLCPSYTRTEPSATDTGTIVVALSGSSFCSTVGAAA